jgi:hypothetical protein
VIERNDRKEIKLCKEDFTCDLKLQCDCDASVARIRVVRTQNPSACETVNCNVCRIAIRMYCL